MKRETKFKLHRRLDQLTAAIPFIVIQLIGLALLCLFPELVTWGLR